MNKLILIYFSIKLNPYQLLWTIQFKEKCTLCIINLLQRQTSTNFKVQNTNPFTYFKYISSILVKEPKRKRSFYPLYGLGICSFKL